MRLGGAVWSDAAVDYAMLTGSLPTVFGWHIHVGENPNPRSLRNFPMQANGAELLRVACCVATELNIEVCAPVHDAVLICAPLDRIEEDIAGMRSAMAEASRVVLGGFQLYTDVMRLHHPGRFLDPRGVRMWDQVRSLISKRQAVERAA
jgi:DNA polymerase I